jgi:A/G-specific adenine glycosylase
VKRISSAFATSFRANLLSFYDSARRKLPWRESNDPYHILVSELMLQQTRVETVIPYYQRWLDRFPHINALADAPVDDVLKQWEGLGYYSRARNLHRAAQMVRERHAGCIPADHHDIHALPGVGPYTAAAVASIAFNQPYAAVDGNVKRVLCRVLDVADPSTAELRDYASKLLDHDRPGDHNQAVMELGATICTPRSPSCSTCPVQQHCRAFRNGTIHLRPAPKAKAAIPHEVVNCVVAVHEGRVLVRQRPSSGLLARLWEFPEVECTNGFQHIGTVTHTFTHKRIEYRVHSISEPLELPGRWVFFDELDQLAFPAAQRKIAEIAQITERSSPQRRGPAENV